MPTYEMKRNEGSCTRSHHHLFNEWVEHDEQQGNLPRLVRSPKASGIAPLNLLLSKYTYLTFGYWVRKSIEPDISLKLMSSLIKLGFRAALCGYTPVIEFLSKSINRRFDSSRILSGMVPVIFELLISSISRPGRRDNWFGNVLGKPYSSVYKLDERR